MRRPEARDAPGQEDTSTVAARWKSALAAWNGPLQPEQAHSDCQQQIRDGRERAVVDASAFATLVHR